VAYLETPLEQHAPLPEVEVEVGLPGAVTKASVTPLGGKHPCDATSLKQDTLSEKPDQNRRPAHTVQAPTMFRVEISKGVAFRQSKKLEDRLADGSGLDHGDIVKGTDEGDGWIKVGEFYIPKSHKGEQIVVRVEALECAGPRRTSRLGGSADGSLSLPREGTESLSTFSGPIGSPSHEDFSEESLAYLEM